jgi:hypothetical protein
MALPKVANYHAHTSPKKLLFGDVILNAFGNLRVYNELFLKIYRVVKTKNYKAIW